MWWCWRGRQWAAKRYGKEERSGDSQRQNADSRFRIWIRQVMQCPATKMFGEDGEGAGTRGCKKRQSEQMTHTYICWGLPQGRQEDSEELLAKLELSDGL